jgi:hypothetical protein
MLTDRLCLADTHEFQSDEPTELSGEVLTLMPKAEALICVQSYTNCQNHILSFFTLCVINLRVANGYDHCKTILLCLKTIYGRMIAGCVLLKTRSGLESCA